MSLDIDMLAQCWLCSWPFRMNRTVSADVRTQSALDALMNEGYPGLLREVGPRVTAEVIRRAAFQDPPLVPRTATRRRLRREEAAEWTLLLRGADRKHAAYYLAQYYGPEDER